MTTRRRFRILRAAIFIGALAALGAFAFSTLGVGELLRTLMLRDRELEEARKQKEELRLRNEALLKIADRLTGERVMAHIVIKDQGVGEDGRVYTEFRIHPLAIEPDESAPPFKGPYHIEGDVVYFETLTIKFDDEYVKMGDAFRGKAAGILTRVFGEKQKPEDGYVVENLEEEPPSSYELGEDSLKRFEREIWKEFWYYATHRAEAKKAGIDAAFGQAPFLKLDINKIYELVLGNRGGLVIREKL
jgi:hypothetical protein